MDIKQFKCDLIDSNSWLIVDNNCGLLIDAVSNQELMKEIEHLDDLVVILTHTHFDHIIGLNDIRKISKSTKVISTRLCSEYITSIYKNMSNVANIYINMAYGINDNTIIKAFTCEKADETFDEELTLEWHDNRIKLKSLQGHSEDGLVVIINDEYLFSGDSLLNIPTVTRFPKGSSEKFWLEDIPYLKTLVHIKRVYPGHGEANDIKTMLQVNKMPDKYNKHI